MEVYGKTVTGLGPEHAYSNVCTMVCSRDLTQCAIGSFPGIFHHF